MAYKWSPNQHEKDAWLPRIRWFSSYFLPGPLCPQQMTMHLEFQLTATNFVSMTAKLSDLVEEIVWSQPPDGGHHANAPTQSVKDLHGSSKIQDSSCLPTCTVLVSSPEAAVQLP